MEGPARQRTVESPLEGTVVRVAVGPGDLVRNGQELVVIESMKMELSLDAPRSGTVASLSVKEGDRVKQGEALVIVE